MTTARRETKPPARWLLLVCSLALLASCTQEPLAAADPQADMPVPKQSIQTAFRSTGVSGVEVPLRVELEARVPAELGDVLAFYRKELQKRGWQEKSEGGVIAANRAVLLFTSPKGPGTLMLDHARGETKVELVQRNTDAVAKAHFLPTSGQSRLIFGYLVPDVASLVINDQTVNIPGGANHPQTLDLPPGTYAYQLLVSGRPVRSGSVTMAAGEAWSLRLGDDTAAEQIY